MKKVKGPRKLLAIVGVLAMLSAMLVPAAVFADEDTAGGSFTAGNNAPTITSVEVIPAAGGSPLTSMTPFVAYKAKIVANDINTVDDIDQVRVAIAFDSDNSDPTADPGETGNTQTLVCLKWVKSGDSWTISPTGGTPATTWSLTEGSCTKPDAAGMLLTQGTWEFYFTVGKVATEGTGGAGAGVPGWDVFGEVKDEGTPVEMWDDRDLAMTWYGEITVNTVSTSFGDTVALGSDFSANVGDTAISIDYIANGPYDEEIKASTPWTDGTYNVVLSADDSPGDNEFALKADDTADVGTAVLVLSASFTPIDETGLITDDDGDAVTANNLWLKLGSSQVMSGVSFAGTITYQIADGS